MATADGYNLSIGAKENSRFAILDPRNGQESAASQSRFIHLEQLPRKDRARTEAGVGRRLALETLT